MSKKEIVSAIPEDINLMSINLLQFNIDATEAFIQKPKKVKGIDFELGKEIAHNIEKGMARYRLFFNCKAINGKLKTIGLNANIGLEFHFFVGNFDRFVKKDKKGNTQIHFTIAASLMNIAYSTARGIILEKTQNSYFNGIIIPIVDSTKYLLEDEKELIVTETKNSISV